MRYPLQGTHSVSHESIPRDRKFRMLRFASLRRVLASALVVAVAALMVASPIGAERADAAATTASELTVAWAGDTSTARAFQPERLPSSPHYDEFDQIRVKVSQTTGVIDQALRVTVTGFARTISSFQSGLEADNAKNYVQAMQCWGPNPLADDFNETCQWGGRYNVEANGLGTSVISDNAARTTTLDFDTARPTNHDVPFRTASDRFYSGKPVPDGNGGFRYPILDLIDPSTTNEINSARIGADGSGTFDFEAQSSVRAPHLGCGTAAIPRCWLVVVPRGTHFGGNGTECSGILDSANDYEPYKLHRPNSVQGGSPINDLCDYWDNRIVIPLEFAPTGASCAIGSAETRVVGSELMVGAMSSWQPALCQSLKTTFSFATNTDSVARARLIDNAASAPRIAYTGFPVSAGELTESERTLLAKTTLSYAPVGISGVVVAFLAENSNGRVEELVLSPRLMAKLLTQSYPFLTPQSQGFPATNAAHLGAVNRTYTFFSRDPEFRALNPNFADYPYNPALILPGPSGADAIRQVWRWIFADDKAVAFLNGVPDDLNAVGDKLGMTVNPYYLPKGNAGASVPWYLDSTGLYLETPVTKLVGLTNLDGSPKVLSQLPLDTFPRDDETVAPLKLTGERSRFDSLQLSPFAESFLSAARLAFRADPRSKNVWNPNTINSVGELGDWVSGGAQLPGQKFMLAITDSVQADRWGLSTASLRGADSTVAVDFSTETMETALTALEGTSLATVKQVNPAAIPADGYPLTIVTYAGVNLTTATAAERTTIANMLTQVTTSGQVPGTEIGQLPAGYLPLTAGLSAEAAASISGIKSYTAPTATQPTNGIAQDDYVSGFGAFSTDGTAAGEDPVVTQGVDELATGVTPTSASEPIARNALVIALVVGLAGFLVAPILFRGRGAL